MNRNRYDRSKLQIAINARPQVRSGSALTFAEKMKLPIFKRRSMAFDMGNYYAANTDVWVYGSPVQYAEFARILTSHTGMLRLQADERGGMDLLMLPIARHAVRDFVVLHERLVHQGGRFNMELIVGGTQSGFNQLAKIFRASVKQGLNNTDDHIHFDSDDELLVLPSVFLNIRSPGDDSDSQLSELVPPSPDDLLPDMEWRDPENWTYEELDGYDSLHGRIPVSKSSEQDVDPNA